MTVSDSIYSSSSTDVPYSPTHTPVLASTSTPRKRKLICITEAFMETTTTSTETEPYIEYKAAFKNEDVGFGGKAFCVCIVCVYVSVCVHVHEHLYNRQCIETRLFPT